MEADLDRGFTALENGNVEEAFAALERCKRIDRKNPDVVTLAAAVADANGETEEALARYKELSELRADDPMPRICIARLQLHDLGDPDAAIETLDGAFDFIDEEADLIEAIVIRTEALLATDDPEAARAALGELSSSVIEDGDLALDLAELALATEDASMAARWIEVAKHTQRLEADALHMLGRVHERTGDRAKMIAAWQQVRSLDMAAPDGAVSISEDELERIASAALDELPANVRAKLDNVPILIDDFPSEELVADGFDPRLLGLFQGGDVTNIHLFKKNLERSAMDLEHLADEVRITVLHETAHYFGLDEADLEALGLD